MIPTFHTFTARGKKKQNHKHLLNSSPFPSAPRLILQVILTPPRPYPNPSPPSSGSTFRSTMAASCLLSWFLSSFPIIPPSLSPFLSPHPFSVSSLSYPLPVLFYFRVLGAPFFPHLLALPLLSPCLLSQCTSCTGVELGRPLGSSHGRQPGIWESDLRWKVGCINE